MYGDRCLWVGLNARLATFRTFSLTLCKLPVAVLSARTYGGRCKKGPMVILYAIVLADFAFFICEGYRWIYYFLKV